MEELLSIDSETKMIKVLGIDVNAKLEQIKIMVNGVDLTKTFALKQFKVIKEELK